MKLTKTNEVLRTFEVNVQKQAKENAEQTSNTGKLVSSINIDDEEKSAHIIVNINMEHYGEWVDEGRKPGKGIPVDVLQKWISSKNMLLEDKNGNELPMTPSRLDSLSYVINRKIKEEGIKPTYFLTDAVDKYFPKLEVDLPNAYADDLIDNLFE